MEPKPGDVVEIKIKEKTVKGILMPRPELLDKEHIIIKLDNGYNIGINKKNIIELKVIEKYTEKKEKKAKLKHNSKLPTISILHTGGTIASKVDYRTGGVVSRFSPEDILEMFPELKDIANIKSRLLFQMFSEDMEPEHWSLLAKEIGKEIKSGVDGVIITHGTDTMHYTSAALSFVVQNPGIPILLVGAQRSSDRGSSDAHMNLICAANFITKSDFAGIAVCMHGTSEDKCCYIHQGTKVRKLHTSRRDAFRSINVFPIAKVSFDGKIEYLAHDLKKKDKNSSPAIKPDFEKKVVIIKIRPGMDHKELLNYKDYKGIVLEGTGLGHAPVTELDEHTKEHKRILETLGMLAKKMPVVMASQCVYGRVDMNVYAPGRDVLSAGVIPAEDMTPETAYVKLAWAIANTKNMQEAKELFKKNISGEITQRIIDKAFLY